MTDSYLITLHYPLLAPAIPTATISTRIARAGRASQLVAATSATPCQMPAGPFFLICPRAGLWHLINSAPRVFVLVMFTQQKGGLSLVPTLICMLAGTRVMRRARS